jgi:hypothetical protein
MGIQGLEGCEFFMIRFKRWNGCKKLINIWFSSILDLVCKSIQLNEQIKLWKLQF